MRLAAAGYDHEAVSIRASGDPAHVALPNVHLVVGLLKRWIIGTHQGAPAAKHLDYYLDEFTFRSTDADRLVAASSSSDTMPKLSRTPTSRTHRPRLLGQLAQSGFGEVDRQHECSR